MCYYSESKNCHLRFLKRNKSKKLKYVKHYIAMGSASFTPLVMKQDCLWQQSLIGGNELMSCFAFFDKFDFKGGYSPWTFALYGFGLKINPTLYSQLWLTPLQLKLKGETLYPEFWFWLSESVNTYLINEIMSLKSWLWSMRQVAFWS